MAIDVFVDCNIFCLSSAFNLAWQVWWNWRFVSNWFKYMFLKSVLWNIAYRTFGKIKMLLAGFDKRLKYLQMQTFKVFLHLSFKAIASEQMLFSASVCREVPGPGPWENIMRGLSEIFTKPIPTKTILSLRMFFERYDFSFCLSRKNMNYKNVFFQRCFFLFV